jgi:LacI family sucrose operon transcriptional repressor
MKESLHILVSSLFFTYQGPICQSPFLKTYSGGIPMSEKQHITINDIANMAGVGKSTVSRYLNNGSVSDKTREKLDAIIKAYDYEPNRFAQSLKKSKSGMIGVVVPTFASFALTEMMRGMDDVNDGDFFLTVNTYHNAQRQVEAVKQLGQQNVDGIVVMTGRITPEMAQALALVDVPVIIQGQLSEDFETVNVDNAYASELVAPLVEKLNPAEVLLLGVDPAVDYNVGEVRFKAIRQMLNDSAKTLYTSFDRDEAEADMTAYLAGHPVPKYLIAATDNIAIGAMSALTQAGVSLPADTKIVAFDNTPSAKIVSPQLSTVAFDYFTLGQWLYRRLKDLANDKTELKDPLLTSHLVRRESW